MSLLSKRTGMLRLLGLLFLVSSVIPVSLCELSGRAHVSFAYVQFDCAPNDAIALNFYVTPKKQDCGKYQGPFLEILIMRNAPSSAPYSIDLDGDAAGFRCVRPGACERATSGSLHLRKFIEGKSASGEYELEFQDGSVERASFDATWCYRKFACG